jgi:hypothetical protein
MDLKICILVIFRYHIFVLVLRIHKSYFCGHDRGGQSANNNNSKLLSIKDLMVSMLVSNGGGGSNGHCIKTKPLERVTYMQASTALALYRGQVLGTNVLIVKPPRKGLDKIVLRQLSQMVNWNQMYAERPMVPPAKAHHLLNLQRLDGDICELWLWCPCKGPGHLAEFKQWAEAREHDGIRPISGEQSHGDGRGFAMVMVFYRIQEYIE